MEEHSHMTQRVASPPVMVSFVHVLSGITCDSGSASTSWLRALGVFSFGDWGRFTGCGCPQIHVRCQPTCQCKSSFRATTVPLETIPCACIVAESRLSSEWSTFRWRPLRVWNANDSPLSVRTSWRKLWKPEALMRPVLSKGNEVRHGLGTTTKRTANVPTREEERDTYALSHPTNPCRHSS